MRARVQKWGNSLALRIPKSVAKEAGLEQDTPVELRLVNGKLIVSPAAEDEVTLEQLLAGITDEKIHEEVDWGPAVGREAW
jgi:antitoxin MazE